MIIRIPLIALLLILAIYSCKKQVEIRNVEVEKKYSWTEVKGLTGTQKIILSSGSSENAVFLQQPFFFSIIKNNNLSINAASLPSDLTIKIPISPNYFAFPSADTSILLCNNNFPFPSPGGFVDLKKLDPTITKINTYFFFL